MNALQSIGIFCLFHTVFGILIQKPNNTIVIANHSTFFNCTVSIISDTFNWAHFGLRHHIKESRHYVYDDQRIYTDYVGRFDVEKNISSGAVNLLVLRPKTSDAGRYECAEIALEDYDGRASAELVVLDSNVICGANIHGVVGLTKCDKAMALDNPVLLSCSVTYNGNIAPQMQWRRDGNLSDFMETSCAVKNNRVTCDTTLDASSIVGELSFVCQIITAEHYNCSLTVSTIYAFPDDSDDSMEVAALMGEEEFCSANTSTGLPCTYNWLEDNKIVRLGQTLTPNKIGKYACSAKCVIRNETCSFTAKRVIVIAVKEYEWLPVVLLALTATLLVIAAIIIILLYRRLVRCRRSRVCKAVFH